MAEKETRLIARRIKKAAGRFDDTEVPWVQGYASHFHEMEVEDVPQGEIFADILNFLQHDELVRYATDPAGSDYFERAWNGAENYRATARFFKNLTEEEFSIDGIVMTCADNMVSTINKCRGEEIAEAKRRIAEIEHYLGLFRDSLKHQLSCAQAAHAFVEAIAKADNGEAVATFDPTKRPETLEEIASSLKYSTQPEMLEEAIDLHLIEIGKYDPILKHHIHAACNECIDDQFQFSMKGIGECFDTISSHLETNIEAVDGMVKGLTRLRRRIDKIVEEETKGRGKSAEE